jgi:4-hydroxy-tetrahydrodipicolinate synthase
VRVARALLSHHHDKIHMMRAIGSLVRPARGLTSRGLATTAPRDPTMSGCLVNLVTPFKPGTTEIDFDVLASTTERQVNAGVSGVIPMGTTGECFAVSFEEHHAIVKHVAEVVNGRCHVVAGTAQPSTADTIKFQESAQKAGATASLTATPYFNKPSQEGMFQHYKEVAKVGLPIVLYNVPGRTNGFATPATLQRIYEACPQLIAVKEATANMDIATEITMRCGGGLTILSGDDSLALPLMAVGGRGVMSVASNLVPDEMVELVRLGLAGEYASALSLQTKLFPLFQSMVAEVNPVPVKVGMEALGLCPGNLRLPLTKATAGTETMVRDALKSLGKI